MKRKVDIDIYETNDYQWFKFASWNRNISRKKVDALKHSLREYGYIGSPITINEFREVIDGQHRLVACSETGVMVQYIQINGLNMESAITLNESQSAWKWTDYVNAYADIGNKNYQILLDLAKEYDTTLQSVVIASTLSTSKACVRRIKSGDFKLSNEEVQRAREMLEYRKLFEPYKAYLIPEERFFTVLFRLVAFGLIDKDRMVEQVQKHATKYRAGTSLDDTVQNINDLYNINSRSKAYFVDKYRQMEEAK